jgi:hypothetical protein
MRSILFLLLFLPFISHAQDDMSQKQKDEIAKTNAALEVRSDGKLRFLSANNTTTQPAVRKEEQRKRLKDDVVHTGNVKYQIGSNLISCDSAIEYTNEDKIAAFNVKITNPVSFSIKGGELNYNKEDNSAILTKEISITAMNGELVGTSEIFTFDFSYQIYRVNGSIKQPKDPNKN